MQALNGPPNDYDPLGNIPAVRRVLFRKVAVDVSLLHGEVVLRCPVGASVTRLQSARRQ
jgi:hypothetical protein